MDLFKQALQTKTPLVFIYTAPCPAIHAANQHSQSCTMI